MVKSKFLPSVYLCIFLDILGLVSYLLPVVGEAEDIVWAPISAVLFYFLFAPALILFLHLRLPGLLENVKLKKRR